MTFLEGNYSANELAVLRAPASGPGVLLQAANFLVSTYYKRQEYKLKSWRPKPGSQRRVPGDGQQ